MIIRRTLAAIMCASFIFSIGSFVTAGSPIEYFIAFSFAFFGVICWITLVLIREE